jgi:Histidine kinase-like ATPase domain
MRAKLQPRGPAAPGGPISGDASNADSGRGLFIIQSLMDHVAYETRAGRNVLSMTKALGASTPKPPHGAEKMAS